MTTAKTTSRIGLQTENASQLIAILSDISKLSLNDHDIDATTITTTTTTTIEQTNAEIPADNDNDNDNDNHNSSNHDFMTELNQYQTKLSAIVLSVQETSMKSNCNNDDGDDNDNDDKTMTTTTTSTTFIPLSAISNAKQILQLFFIHVQQKQQRKLQTIHALKMKLENQLKQCTQLSFSNNNKGTTTTTTAATTSTTATTQYNKRIEKLKLKIEERNYKSLTSNLNTKKEDDATLSSMLYASSVGMNMIVAPISIGVIMYFFAGKLSVWIFGADSGSITGSNRKEGQLNIHGVIVGVLSGVIMLFIEMILFVIRNHEMDTHLTNKKKRSKSNAFGYDPRTAERTFHG